MNQTENRRLSMKYAQMYKTKKINEKAVLTSESYWGREWLIIHMRYLLNYMEERRIQRFHAYMGIGWFENNQAVLDQSGMIKGYDLYYLAVMNYVEALASCKYLINNVTFPQYFIKREGQIYINTWHGTPLKKYRLWHGRGK